MQLANVHVPFLFKQAVDGLSGGATAVPLWGVAALTPATLLVGYGLARGGAALCNGAPLLKPGYDRRALFLTRTWHRAA